MRPGEDQSSHAARGDHPRTAHGPIARSWRGTPALALWGAALALSAGIVLAAGDSVRVLQDRAGDAVVRRMDAGADGLVDPTLHRQPDILAVRMCRWQPGAPQDDLFVGAASAAGDFFRLDLVFAGLVNPPGPTGCCGFPFAPFRYGENPVFGYVEIDVDPDANAGTGGELDLPHLMFPGNAARFGGLPVDPFLNSRCARDASAFDSNIATPPFVDRGGEDFHIALHGWEIVGIQRSVPTNLLFGPGDVWVVSGRLFPRAHGYERFSFADTAGQPGLYSPLVHLRFAHSIVEDRTTVSLVYPLTNRGSAAQMNTTIIEPLDGDASNQNSVLEAIDDLVFSVANASAIWRNDSAFALIAPWGLLQPVPAPNSAAQFLDPLRWRITVLVAGSYTAPSNDAQFVWSDILPDILPGDFNGDGGVDWRDRLLLRHFIRDHDGLLAGDKDGQVNCAVALVNFGPNFSVFDLNYDGRVDAADLPALTATSSVPGDLDRDGDVDQTDFGLLQTCLAGPLALSASGRCADADLDLDHDVDGEDMAVLAGCAAGPAVPADPACWPPGPFSCPAADLAVDGANRH